MIGARRRRRLHIIDGVNLTQWNWRAFYSVRMYLRVNYLSVGCAHLLTASGVVLRRQASRFSQFPIGEIRAETSCLCGSKKTLVCNACRDDTTTTRCILVGIMLRAAGSSLKGVHAPGDFPKPIPSGRGGGKSGILKILNFKSCQPPPPLPRQKNTILVQSRHCLPSGANAIM